MSTRSEPETLPIESLSFETALRELEQIVGRLEKVVAGAKGPERLEPLDIS